MIRPARIPLAALAAAVLTMVATAPPTAPARGATPGPRPPGQTAPAPAPPPGETGRPPSDSPFPSPESLEDLTETPLPEGVFDRPVVVVDAWDLAGPFPNVVAAVPYRDPSDWGALLEAEAARRAGLVVATEAMHCAAREWGRFRLAHGAPPGPSLTTWIGARCSTSTPHISFHHFDGGVPADASEAEVFEGWREAVGALLAEHLAGGPRAAGIWYGREAGHAIVVIASGERLLHVEPLATVLEDDGSFVLRGELLVAAQEVAAAVNRGRFGVEDCERNGALTLPRFAFRCRTDPADDESWLTVSITPPGRLLGRGALGLVLWPSGAPHARWRRPSLGEPVLLGPGTEVETEITALVNRVREDAGLGPLELSAAQSVVAGRLAPYYFASSFGLGPATTSDLVILGLLAGWNVEGVVQGGSFASSWVVRSRDLDHLVATALQYPSGRRTLLDPEARRLAVGAVARDDGAFLAGIFGTYSVFEEATHDEAARRVIEALDAARAARGRPKIQLLPAVASLGRLAASRVQGGETPADVLSDLLRQSSQVLRRSVNGWFVETRDLDRIAFPEALLDRDAIEVAVGVSHHKPAGEPWGRWVILLVASEPAGQGA